VVTLPPTAARSRNCRCCACGLQDALIYVTTLMVHDVLADEDRSDELTAEDRRRLTPLFRAARRPRGEVKLDMKAGWCSATRLGWTGH
jgi:hypothetical protein